MDSFYDLFTLIKQGKIRVGNILEIHSLIEDDFLDYCQVKENDIISLITGEYLFDSYFIMDLLDKYEFKIIYKKEEKDKIFKKLRRISK